MLKTSLTISELEANIADATSSAEKSSFLLALAWKLRDSEPHRARALCDEALYLLAGFPSPRDYAIAHLILCVANWRLNLYGDAIRFGSQSLSQFESIHDTLGIAHACQNIAICHYFLGDYARALFFYNKSLHSFTEINNIDGIANTLNNIGIIYHRFGNLEEGLAHFQKSLEIKRKSASAEIAATTNIGIIYKDLHDRPTAIAYYEKALALCEQYHDLPRKGAVLHNLGMIHADMEEYEKAFAYMKNSLSIFENIGDRYGQGLVFLSLGRAFSQRSLSYD